MNPLFLFGLGYFVWRWLNSPGAEAEAGTAPYTQPAPQPELAIPQAAVVLPGGPVQPNPGAAQSQGARPQGGAPQGGAPQATKPAPATPYAIKDRQRLDAGHVVAKELAKDLGAKGKNVNREILRRFQRIAGLQVDGVYGPKTAGALRWFTVEPPAKPNGIEIAPHAGTGFAPYAPAF